MNHADNKFHIATAVLQDYQDRTTHFFEQDRRQEVRDQEAMFL